jgi:hypothetical protein
VTYRDHATYCSFPVRSPRDGGSLLAPLCPPPRLVPTKSNRSHQGNDKGNHKGNHKGKTKESRPQTSYPSSEEAMKEGMGSQSGPLLVLARPSASCLLFSSLSCLSRVLTPTSHCAPSSAGVGTHLPTSVAERKSSTAWLHLALARSRILNGPSSSQSPSAPSPTESSAGPSSGGSFEGVLLRLCPVRHRQNLAMGWFPMACISCWPPACSPAPGFSPLLLRDLPREMRGILGGPSAALRTDPNTAAIPPRGRQAVPQRAWPIPWLSRPQGNPCVLGHQISMMMSGLAVRSARDVLRGLDRIHLAGTRFLRGHALDGGLGIREDRDHRRRRLAAMGSGFQPHGADDNYKRATVRNTPSASSLTSPSAASYRQPPSLSRPRRGGSRAALHPPLQR